MVLFTQNNVSYYGGWVPDKPDARDIIWTPRGGVVVQSPQLVDLSSSDGPIFNQGQLGSCGPNSTLGLMQFISIKEFADTFQGSRLYLYYYGRKALGPGYVNQDSGTQIRDLMKVLATMGVPLESLYPYNISVFKQQPPQSLDADAAKHKVIQYMRVQQDVGHLVACLTEGYPFVFGFTVSQSFETQSVASTGVMPVPAPGEQVLGGHAVMGVGYLPAGTVVTTMSGQQITLTQDYFKVRNSWGAQWGLKGYFLMPAAFLSNPANASDIWTARVVTDGDKSAS